MSWVLSFDGEVGTGYIYAQKKESVIQLPTVGIFGYLPGGGNMYYVELVLDSFTSFYFQFSTHPTFC